jgi:chitinase
MTAPSPDPVQATWSTLDLADTWLATPGADFAATNGTIDLAPGQTSTTIDITVHGDTLDEADEHVLVALTDPTNAAVGGFLGLGFGGIVDDDPLPRLVPGLATVAEGDDGTTTVSIPVTLSAASGRTVRASWSTLGLADTWLATPGADFAAAGGTIELAPGQTTTTIGITVHGDTLDEADEHVLVALTHPANAAIGGFFGLGFASILDDDGAS